MLQLPQVESFRDDPRQYETIKRLVDAVNKIGQQTGVDPSGSFTNPIAVDGLTVLGADGIFDVLINDSSNSNARGLSYFVEASTDIGFSAPYKWELGATKTMRVHLGNITLYWRAYSQYVGSSPSTYIYFGSPTAVAGGGTGTGPDPGALPRPNDPPGYGNPDDPIPLPPAG